MRCAAALLLLLAALSARAQPQPDVPPAAPEQAEPVQAAPAEPRAEETLPPAAEPSRPAPKPAAAKPAPKPAAPPPQEDPRDADITALHAEVARLQSELDAERAAALPPPEEAPAAPRPAGGALAWLALAVVLALAAGFILGWRMLDRRVRRRYGGLKIY